MSLFTMMYFELPTYTIFEYIDIFFKAKQCLTDQKRILNQHVF
jgi:hypothetical protein